MTAAAPVDGPHSLWTPRMFVVALVLLLGALASNLLIPASGYLGGRGFDQGQIGLIMGAFNVASLLSMLVVGRVIARLGHGAVLAMAGAVIALGAFTFGLADVLPLFALGRAAQGLGLGALLVAAGAYVVEISPPARLGEALGISGILTLTAQAAGPSLADALRRAVGWPAVFWTAAIVGALAIVPALRLPAVTSAQASGRAALRRAWGALLATAGAGLGYGAIWTFLADYARRLGGVSVAWFFAPYVVGAMVSRIWLGGLADRQGRARVSALALLGHVGAFVVLALAHGAAQFVVVGVVYGVCHGLYYPAMQALVVERAGGTRRTAVAAAVLAYGLGIVAAAWGLAPLARAAGYPTFYAVAAGVGAAAALLVWRRG